MKFTFAALVLAKLQPSQHLAMTTAITDSILQKFATGYSTTGYTKNHIAVVLKSGFAAHMLSLNTLVDIIAEVSITPKQGATAAALIVSSLHASARGAITTTMLTKVKAIPYIQDAVVFGKALGDLAVTSEAPTTAKATTKI